MGHKPAILIHVDKNGILSRVWLLTDIGYKEIYVGAATIVCEVKELTTATLMFNDVGIGVPEDYES